MRGALDVRHLLEGIGQSDEPRVQPVSSPAQEGEGTVVVAGPHPQALAFRIEADQWHEHQVQVARRQASQLHRLHYSKMIAMHRATGFDELHAAPAQVGQTWQVDAAAVLLAQAQQRVGSELRGQRRIDGDAQAGTEVEDLADVMGDGRAGGAALRQWDRPAQLL